jgi:hypothetical protein
VIVEGTPMNQPMWVRSHVEVLLQREWDLCRVLTDPEGDFPYRQGTAACWVSVLDLEPPMVRVFGHAAFGLKPSLRLLRELNDIQSRSLTATVQLAGDAVVVSQTVCAIGLTQPVLSQALNAVGELADEIGPLLAALFDGATPFPIEAPDPEEATPE